MRPRRGTVFYQPELPGKKGRIWLVATEPDSAGRVVLLSFSTYRGQKGDDPACKVQGSVHGALDPKRESFVAYYFAKRESADQIGKLLTAKHIIEKPPLLSDALMMRILKCAEQSDPIRPQYEELLVAEYNRMVAARSAGGGHSAAATET